MPHHRDRYLLELIETCLKTIERQTRRLDREAEEDRETLHLIQRELYTIAQELQPPTLLPQLTSIKILFSKGTRMPTPGPLTLTTAGQTGTAVVTGVDQFGNPWTGAIPPVTYAIDNPAIATSTPNPDGLTDLITAVANGTANLTGSLTTAEGLALSDVEQVIVAIQAAAPVLSAVKIMFQ